MCAKHASCILEKHLSLKQQLKRPLKHSGKEKEGHVEGRVSLLVFPSVLFQGVRAFLTHEFPSKLFGIQSAPTPGKVPPEIGPPGGTSPAPLITTNWQIEEFVTLGEGREKRESAKGQPVVSCNPGYPG